MKSLTDVGKVIFIIVLSLFLLLCGTLYFANFNTKYCVNFQKENVGVVFSAYVKTPSEDDGPISDGWKGYSLESVKTMLEVISGKFSRVATYGVGADIVPYVRNVTYYDSFGQVYTAEAAALINKERNEKVLTMLVGIWQSDIAQQMETETALALESAQKANEIFPGTVEGLVISNTGSFKHSKRALDNIRELKGRSELKIGSRQNCDNITSGEFQTLTEIVKESDFIFCEIYPSADKNYMLGTEMTVEVEFLRIRNMLKTINPNIEVMGQTGWSSKGTKAWENTNTLREYWHAMNAFARKHDFKIWMMEAFDNPWKTWAPREAHFGWWKLKDNSEIELKEGYLEKVLENNPCTNHQQQETTE